MEVPEWGWGFGSGICSWEASEAEGQEHWCRWGVRAGTPGISGSHWSLGDFF